MEEQARKYGAFSSSENPQKLAATVTGIIKAIGGFAAFFVVGAAGGDTAPLSLDFTALADNAGQLVTLGYAFWGVAETCFGIVRKIAIVFIEKVRTH